ncbi:MAG: HlyD family secretion protein [candidate division NC10 bacterium]|nr:HlyD family secretion protein [candidate division NC10 bacterium]
MGLLVGGFFAAKWLAFRLHYVSTQDAHVGGDLIAVSPKVSGKIVELPVEQGDSIRAGQLIAQIEKIDYELALAQAQASLERYRSEYARALAQKNLTGKRVTGGIASAEVALRQAEDNLHKAEASLQAARARVRETGAEMKNAERQFERGRKLYADGIISADREDELATALKTAESRYQEALENEKEAEGAVRLAQATVKRAKVDLDLAKEEWAQVTVQDQEIKILEARIREREEQVKAAQVRLAETTILSPIDGVISKRIVNLGEMIQPGQPIVFVNDPRQCWIVANIEETHIRKVQMGAPVLVRVDAYPGKTLVGKVIAIGSATSSEFSLLPADNPSGNFIKVTRRIPVRISVASNPDTLRPGMMVWVAIQADG